MNCFIDYFVLAQVTKYAVPVVVAQVVSFMQSYNQHMAGFVSRLSGFIPVVRPIDQAYPATGLVYSIGNKLIGQGTKFTKELSVGTVLIAGFTEGKITGIISDTEAECSQILCNEPKNFRVVPQLNHSQMFGKVLSQLQSGKPMAIFPEGRTHDTPGTIPYKSGINKIIQSAIEQNIDIGVYAVGVNYSYPEYSRNNATICISKRINVSKEWIQNNSAKTVIQKLENEMKILVVDMETWNEVKLVYFTANALFKQDGQKKIEIWGKIVEGLKTYKKLNRKTYDEILADFIQYRKTVSDKGLSKYIRRQTLFSDFVASCLIIFLLFLLVRPN
jgi:1-acyl-sn-glycerol-3-phosphate acyltransferase